MKRAVAMAFVAMVVLAGLSVGAAELPTDPLYSVSFENYEKGEPLSDAGAVGGTWGVPAVPTGMEVYADEKSDGTMFMNCISGDRGTSVDGISFMPTNTSTKTHQSVEVAMMAGIFESMPTFPEGAKTGFIVYVPEGGATSLVAWAGAAKCWTNLSLRSGLALPDSAWQNLLAKFLKRDDGRLFVQYRLMVDGQYIPLETQEHAVWIDLGACADDTLVRKVEIRGDGGLESLNGAKQSQGLYVGVGTWREMKGYETPYDHSLGTWQNGRTPTFDAGRRAYVINVFDDDPPNVYKPDMRRAAAEAIEVSCRFTSTSKDESATDDICSLIRIVAEDGMADTQTDPVYRFACLVDGEWKTHPTMLASLDKDYVVQILLDSDNGTVVYRIREGLGYDGGTYVTLFEGSLSPDVFGRYSDVYFKGSGLVYKIKETDRTSTK